MASGTEAEPMEMTMITEAQLDRALHVFNDVSTDAPRKSVREALREAIEAARAFVSESQVTAAVATWDASQGMKYKSDAMRAVLEQFSRASPSHRAVRRTQPTINAIAMTDEERSGVEKVAQWLDSCGWRTEARNVRYAAGLPQKLSLGGECVSESTHEAL